MLFAVTSAVYTAMVNPTLAMHGSASLSLAASQRAAVAPTMIIDQLKKAADDAKGAAAEVVVAQKVAKKLADAQDKYDIPAKYVDVMGGFFTSYMTEVYKAGRDVDYYETVLTSLFKKVLERSKEPHKFDPFHRAMREPFDYYELGNEFATGVINREDSPIRGMEAVEKIQKQLAAGDNVVLLANHQSEADPQIFSVRARARCKRALRGGRAGFVGRVAISGRCHCRCCRCCHCCHCCHCCSNFSRPCRSGLHATAASSAFSSSHAACPLICAAHPPRRPPCPTLGLCRCCSTRTCPASPRTPSSWPATA